MFISYTIEDLFFSNFIDSKNIDLSFEKINNLLDQFEKNTRLIDCSDENRKEHLNRDWYSVYESLLSSDTLLKKQFEVLWLDRILKKTNYAPKNTDCNCKSTADCSLDENISHIQKVCKSFPHFVLSHNPTSNKYPNISLENFRENELFRKYYDRTSYEEELELDEQSGIKMIKKNWAGLIQSCKNNITIYDRNIFEKWDSNYAGGMRQFANVIMELNPALNFNLITRRGQHKSSYTRSPKSQHDIKNEIVGFINSLKPCRIEVILCDTDAKHDHDRFIIFDDSIAAELNRGLDSFYAESSTGYPKIDRYRIIYYKIEEVRSYLQDPLRNKSRDSEFMNLKNY